jgi:hypothetical protein
VFADYFGVTLSVSLLRCYPVSILTSVLPCQYHYFGVTLSVSLLLCYPVSIIPPIQISFSYNRSYIIWVTDKAFWGCLAVGCWERRIFGSRRDEVTGEWRKLHSEELNGLYCSPNVVRVTKWRRMRWAVHVERMGERRGVYRVVVGKSEGKWPLGRPRHRWEDKNKMDLQEVGCGCTDWIELVQDRDRWRHLWMR